MTIERHYSLSRVRTGIMHFLGGKLGSGALSFLAFLLIARMLPVTEYGRYVAALALVELGMALGTLGLDWVAARYIPEYRVLASEAILRRYVLRLVGLQSAVYLVVALVIAAASAGLGTLLGVHDAVSLLQLYGGYLVLEACGRVVRDQVLGHLLLQGRAQLVLLARNVVWVVALAALMFGDPGTLRAESVAIADIAAAATGLLAGLVVLAVTLRSGKSIPGEVRTPWVEPDFAIQARLARSAYVSYLFSLAYGPQIVTFIVNRIAGAEATAAFGFARNLVDQIRRYLPADLLLGMVRPALIARYSTTSDFASFSRHASLLFVMSAIALSPLIVLTLVFGQLVVDVIGRSKFVGSDIFVLLFLLTLVPFSHRRIIEMIANSIACADACARASAALVAFPLVILVTLLAGQPVWAVVALAFVAELLFNLVVVSQLRRRGFGCVFPWRPVLRIGIAVLLAAACLSLAAPDFTGIVGLIAAAVASIITTALFVWLAHPLDREASALIRRSLVGVSSRP